LGLSKKKYGEKELKTGENGIKNGNIADFKVLKM